MGAQHALCAAPWAVSARPKPSPPPSEAPEARSTNVGRWLQRTCMSSCTGWSPGELTVHDGNRPQPKGVRPAASGVEAFTPRVPAEARSGRVKRNASAPSPPRSTATSRSASPVGSTWSPRRSARAAVSTPGATQSTAQHTTLRIECNARRRRRTGHPVAHHAAAAVAVQPRHIGRGVHHRGAERDAHSAAGKQTLVRHARARQGEAASTGACACCHAQAGLAGFGVEGDGLVLRVERPLERHAAARQHRAPRGVAPAQVCRVGGRAIRCVGVVAVRIQAPSCKQRTRPKQQRRSRAAAHGAPVGGRHARPGAAHLQPSQRDEAGGHAANESKLRRSRRRRVGRASRDVHSRAARRSMLRMRTDDCQASFA